MAPILDSKGQPLPEVWAHRGASLEFPENSLASFKAAIAEGSEGIESDVHTTSDGRILMFHDPSLERTTDGTGEIKTQPWHGCIENVRTLKKPHQQIPLFDDLIDLLMQPNAMNVRLNIDLKPNNDAEIVFPIMRKIITQVPDWQTKLAPRIILGLWHPKFIVPAYEILPNLTIHHITPSLSLSQSHFWPYCSGFSVAYPLLISPAGRRFMDRCKAEGKEFGVWTVNSTDEMVKAAALGAGWILTDTPAICKEVRRELAEDFDAAYAKHVGWGLGAYKLDWRYWAPHSVIDNLLWKRLIKAAGPIEYVPEDFRKGQSAVPRIASV